MEKYDDVIPPAIITCTLAECLEAKHISKDQPAYLPSIIPQGRTRCSSDKTILDVVGTFSPMDCELSVVSEMSSFIEVPMDVKSNASSCEMVSKSPVKQIIRSPSELQHHRERESIRRKEIQNSVDRLCASLPTSPLASLKEVLASAINVIKDLRYESSLLMAQRCWLILENREAGEYLQELRGMQGCKAELREDERTLQEEWWDAVQKQGVAKMEMEGWKMDMSRLLEETRIQKRQLHAEYVAKTSGDAIRGEMENGGWCSDTRCPAAPHRIHHGGGKEPWWMDGDGGWVEDTNKTKLDDNRCPDERLHQPLNCTSNNFVSKLRIGKEKNQRRKRKKRSLNNKSANDRTLLPVKKKKKGDESKNGSDFLTHHVKLESVDIESTNDRMSEPKRKRKENYKSKNGSDALTHCVKLEPVDIEGANSRVSAPDIGQSESEINSGAIKQEPLDFQSTNDRVTVTEIGHIESKINSGAPSINAIKVKKEPLDFETTSREPVSELLGDLRSTDGTEKVSNNSSPNCSGVVPGKLRKLLVPIININLIKDLHLAHKRHSQLEQNLGEPDHRSSDLDMHLIPLPSDRSVLVRIPCKPGDVNSACGSTCTSVVELDPEHVTEGNQRISPGSVSSKEQDFMDSMAQAGADATESADKSSSDDTPMSCMLCDKPFDNIDKLQSHLMSNHAS